MYKRAAFEATQRYYNASSDYDAICSIHDSACDNAGQTVNDLGGDFAKTHHDDVFIQHWVGSVVDILSDSRDERAHDFFAALGIRA